MVGFIIQEEVAKLVLTLRDGFGLLQCIVAKNDIVDELFEILKE